MVVFPLVPVTPTSFSFCVGFPKNVVAAGPTASSHEGTRMYVTFPSVVAGIVSHITASAPASVAFCMKRCPSTCVPRMATKRQPGFASRLSMQMSVMSRSVLPVTASVAIRLVISVSFMMYVEFIKSPFCLVVCLQAVCMRCVSSHFERDDGVFLHLRPWCYALFLHLASALDFDLHASAFEHEDGVSRSHS